MNYTLLHVFLFFFLIENMLFRTQIMWPQGREARQSSANPFIWEGAHWDFFSCPYWPSIEITCT